MSVEKKIKKVLGEMFASPFSADLALRNKALENQNALLIEQERAQAQMITQLNAQLAEIHRQINDGHIADIVKKENENYLSQIAEKTQVCARALDALSDEAKQQVAGAIA